MSDAGISRVVPLAMGDLARPKTDDPAKVRDAAQQFEALLLGQILRSAKQGNSGWLGSGEGSSGDSIADFADEQLASVMSQQGGLGLSDLIAKGLKPHS